MSVRIPELGRLLKQLRLERDIDQKEVSAAVRYSTRSLRRLEKEGERPERAMLIRILTKGLGIQDLRVVNHFLIIARYLALTADEGSHYGISVSSVIGIAAASVTRPEPQETRWGPTDDKAEGICITSSATGEFIPWAELRPEIEKRLLNQLGRHIPPKCTVVLDAYRGRPNWLVRIIDPDAKQVGFVWFGTDPDKNWAYDGLVRAGDDSYVVWQVLQRYSDGSYRRIREQAPRLQRVAGDSSS